MTEMKRLDFFKYLLVGFGGAVLLSDWEVPKPVDNPADIMLKPGEIRSIYLPPTGDQLTGSWITITNPTRYEVFIPFGRQI